VLLGGISGYFGGMADMIIQRVIELMQSLPTIPIWLAPDRRPAAGLATRDRSTSPSPSSSPDRLDQLARVVRGRFLSLREEDFVMAAELAGCSQMRIIFRHMVPVLPEPHHRRHHAGHPGDDHQRDLALFLGLGMRPPAISWGVLLQEAQNIQTLAISPWLLAAGHPGHRRHPGPQLHGRRLARRGRSIRGIGGEGDGQQQIPSSCRCAT
jgi:peptide/nickel transport system permease protein